jgi:hypothetical protein
MNAHIKRLFSQSVIDPENFNDKKDKIELVSCPRKEIKCKEQLTLINKIYVDTEYYLSEKYYQRSIEILQSAFYITTELTDHPCVKCAELFRSTIIESLENIQNELKKSTSGFFGKKNLKSSLILAEDTLAELKGFTVQNTFKIHNPRERYIGNCLKNIVI